MDMTELDMPEIRQILIEWISNMSDADLLKMYTVASVSADTGQDVSTMIDILTEAGISP